MTDCPRQGRLIGGCKFEGRYDRGGVDIAKLGRIEGNNPEILDAITRNLSATTYVHDICIRCGETVKRA